MAWSPTPERPEANVTGVTSFDPQQPRKQLELLKEAMPGIQRVAILGDRGVSDALMRASEEQARALGLQTLPLRVSGPSPDLEGAFAAMRQERAEALLVLAEPVMGAQRKAVVCQARRPSGRESDAIRVGREPENGSRNRRRNVAEGPMLSLQDIQDILRIKLIGVIRESESVLQASNQGVPAIHDKESEVAQAYSDGSPRPAYLAELQRELVAVISKYVSIKAEDIKVNFEKQDQLEVLEVNVELPDGVAVAAPAR